MLSPFDVAADLDTPVSAYLKLRPLRPRFLLESVESGDRLGRYSFIGFGEASLVRLGVDRLLVGQEARPTPQALPELLDALRTALARAPRPRAEGVVPPFAGGLVGVASYDLARRIETLPDRLPPRPGEPLAAFLAPRSVLAFDHLTRRAALLHAGTDSERRDLKAAVSGALRGPVPCLPRSGRYESPRPNLAEAEFCSAVARAKEHIAAGDVFQLVLSVRFTGACDAEPFQVYRALRVLNPSPYMYFLDFDDFAVVGSSPEALVRLEGRRASLRPIAGTRPRGADADEDARHERELLADPKEAAEHVMLVDLARNDLGRVAVPGSIHVRPSRSVERYSHVMHLVSGVEGVLAPGADAFDLFAAAFPAGTVVGAPKVRAMELIEELEPERRGFYAGTVGYFGNGGSMDQAIAIRTLLFRDGTYTFQAGAGIVADSRPEREHAEVIAKGAALRAALALAEEEL
jgi:anthranilate synthase component 1